MVSRPSLWACSVVVSVSQSSSRLPARKIRSGSTGSIASPRSRSSASSAASNSSATSAGSGPHGTKRGAASTLPGLAGRSPRSRAGGTGRAVGSPATGPASIASSRRRSSTEVASGPSVDRSIQSGIGRRPISPPDGLMPASPHSAAGIRIEPPPSVAVASGTIPAASAAPEPPLEPPGDHRSAQGLRVTPNRLLVV